MKKSILTSSCAALLTLFILGIGVGSAGAQTTDRTGPQFNILVESGDEAISLECTRGCAWKQLSFKLPDGTTQFIDEMGMATEEDNDKQTMDMADFHISLQRNGEEIICTSSHTTGWTELSFHCAVSPCKASIDASGVNLK